MVLTDVLAHPVHDLGVVQHGELRVEDLGLDGTDALDRSPLHLLKPRLDGATSVVEAPELFVDLVRAHGVMWDRGDGPVQHAGPPLRDSCRCGQPIQHDGHRLFLLESSVHKVRQRFHSLLCITPTRLDPESGSVLGREH